jgi:hypothetical protein
MSDASMVLPPCSLHRPCYSPSPFPPPDATQAVTSFSVRTTPRGRTGQASWPWDGPPPTGCLGLLARERGGPLTLGCCSFRPMKPIPVYRFRILLFLKYFRNHSKFLKFVEICLNFIKMQIKLYMNPLKQIYSIGLTKFAFVHYCIVENYKNSNFGVFNYKNP